MKMVDTGQTSSDGPAVVPQTEWNLDEEQKDLRRESRKNCKWFKANLIILFIAIALTGTWISSLQQSVVDAEVSLDLSIVLLDSCDYAAMKSQHHFEETILPKYLNGSNSSNYEILWKKQVLCETMAERDKAKIENSIACYLSDHNAEHFHAECLLHLSFWFIDPRDFPPQRQTTTEEGVSFETMQRMNCLEQKSEFFKKNLKLRCYDMHLYIMRLVLPKSIYDRLTWEKKFTTFQTYGLKNKKSLPEYIFQVNILTKNFVSVSKISIRNKFFENCDICLLLVIAVLSSLLLKEYKTCNSKNKNEVKISKYFCYSLCWLIIGTVTLLFIYNIVI